MPLSMNLKPLRLVEGKAYSRIAILNRPHDLNALNYSIGDRLLKLYKNWEDDPDIGFVVLKNADGDIIDCVHISQQPAFDHPFLKDHKIQIRPSYHPEVLYNENQMASKAKHRIDSITQLWHMNGRCLEDTIPVRRTEKEYVMRASSVKRYGKKKHRAIPKPRSTDPDLINESGHQHAIAYVEGDKYYGAKATINMWEPKVQQSNEFSLSQLWILGGSFGDDVNSIEAGWQLISLRIYESKIKMLKH